MHTVSDQVDLHKSSEKAFQRAKTSIPGGVNSPVRAYTAVGGHPVFVESAQGAEIKDIEGKTYLDYVGSWGPMLLGHADPDVVEAVRAATQKGLSFGAPCEQEFLLSEKICAAIPSVEKVRMVNSGTEATMTAIRLARGITQRNKIIKFKGCYHGHVDALLVEAGSGPLTLGQPSSLGIPRTVVADTLVAEFNNIASVEALFSAYSDEIAAIILEPICGNMGVVLPKNNFITSLRALCDKHHSLLIFDEVMTGFRVSPAGFQGLSTVQPDLTTLGKVIGGGMPVGAVGGAAKYMDQLAPTGGIYQAGTLSGNPIAMTAGLVTLEKTSATLYQKITQSTQQLAEGCVAAAKLHGIPLVVNATCGMLTLFFTESSAVETYGDTQTTNTNLFKAFFHGLLQQGVYWAPSAFEAAFLSAAHTEIQIDRTLKIINRVFSNLSLPI